MKFRPNYLSALLVAAALGAGCDVRVGENGVSVDVGGGKASNEWTRTYTVAKGDSLSKIAKKFYGNANKWRAIFEANGDQLSNPDLIKPGQVLKIPNQP